MDKRGHPQCDVAGEEAKAVGGKAIIVILIIIWRNGTVAGVAALNLLKKQPKGTGLDATRDGRKGEGEAGGRVESIKYSR